MLLAIVIVAFGMSVAQYFSKKNFHDAFLHQCNDGAMDCLLSPIVFFWQGIDHVTHI
jgi:hypothetical protein